MTQFLLFLILGLGSGAAYSLLANGIVAIYKGSGVLNFAQGGVAMFATYCYVALINAHISKYVAVVGVMSGAAACGALIAVGVIRPLRNAPVLARVVATFGLLTALQGLATIIWGTNAELVPTLFPTHVIRLASGAEFGVDRLYMLGATLLLAAVLWSGFKFTRLGLATQAASENERGAALLGFSPTVIAAANWALGSALAALAGVLIAPLTSLDPVNLALVVLPAMAAALVGRFASFGITTLAAVAIGCGQSELLNLWTQPGIQTAAPFVVVIVAMVVAGRAIPRRGAVSEGRPPTAPAARIRPLPVASGLAVVVVMLANFDATYQSALATSLTSAILALSLVVVTGFVGQVSVMQMTFAGLGGFVTAKLAANLGVPFPLSILAAAAIIGPVGALLGLPALRVRGLSLAVVTLGAAIAIDAVVFQNATWTGGLNGEPVPIASLAGFSFNPFVHPTRYGLFVLTVLVLLALVVSNLRRSRAGRQMLAVRSNERAAAAAGVNVAAIKLQAFALSAVIAAIGGGVMAYSNAFIGFGTGQFAAAPSITLLTVAYIGGIASVSGALMAGGIVSGGVVYVALSGIRGFDKFYLAISGAALIWTVIAQPDGGAVLLQQQWRAVRRRGWLRRRVSA